MRPKRIIFIYISILLFTGCGTVKRGVKNETTTHYRDSSKMEQICSSFTDNIKTIKDNSRLKITYYMQERDAVTGEQLKDREEVYDYNITIRDSVSKKGEVKTNVVVGSLLTEVKKETKAEKRGLNNFQLFFICLGIGTAILIGGMSYFKRYRNNRN